jgi:hypothetical protein
VCGFDVFPNVEECCHAYLAIAPTGAHVDIAVSTKIKYTRLHCMFFV